MQQNKERKKAGFTESVAGFLAEPQVLVLENFYVDRRDECSESCRLSQVLRVELARGC